MSNTQEKEMFKEWLDNPISELFFKYLKDSAKDDARLVGETIYSGGMIEKEEQIRISTTCATLIRISDIDYDEIESFYEEK